MKTKRNKLTNFLKLGILFFGISLLLFNCEQREFPEEMETVSIDNKYQTLNIDEVTGFMGDFKAKKSLEKSDEGINLNVDVNSLKFEEVENDDLSIPIFNATTKFTKANSKLFLVKVEGTIKGFLLNKTRKENTSGSKFTGVTIITDLEGNFINGYRVEDDIFISQFVSKKEENKERALLSKMMSEPVFYGGTLDEVIIRSYSGGGGSSGPRGLSFTSIRGGGSQWSHENSTGGSSNGSSGDGNDEDERAGGSAQVFPCNDPLHGCRDIERCGEGYERNNNNECVLIEIVEEEDDKIITDNLNNPCVENILKELQKKDTKNAIVPDLTGVSHLSQTILDLFDTSTNDNLTFEIKQLGSTSAGEINAQTTNVTGGWKITLDTDLVKNGTQLFMAKTLIHESMHAFIKYNLKTNRTSNLATDLNALYQKFKSQNNSSNLTHHEFMSQYVEALSYSLAAYDNHQQPNVYYKMLSWGGLETSTVYQALSNKTEIQNAINNERYGKSNAKGKKCD
jgi:hypothetical protein